MLNRDVSYEGLAAMCTPLRPWSPGIAEMLQQLAWDCGLRPSFIVRGYQVTGYCYTLLRQLREKAKRHSTNIEIRPGDL